MRGTVPGASALAALLMLGACSGEGTKGAPAPETAAAPRRTSSSSHETPKSTPSESTKMVCGKEARAEIASALGVRETRVTPPTWIEGEHLYSCSYVYPRGTIVLSVRELSSAQETTDYFDGIAWRDGTTRKVVGLGQGAWLLKDNDVVVRKDYKVLLVDVEGIPSNFLPLVNRSDVATGVGAVIMGCWGA